VLAGAAAHLFEGLLNGAPGKNQAFYQGQAQRYARAWNRGLQKYRPSLDEKIGFEKQV
jgi:hypothetical protein